MSDDLRIERIASSLITSAAPSRAPDGLLDATLVSVGRTRQRARWLAVVKAPPMRAPTGVVVGSPTVRLSAFIALTVALVLGLTVAVAAGAALLLNRSIEPAPPYGPATNGVISYGKDGDIWVADADGRHPRVLIGNTLDDGYPYFTPDGTRFLFTRIIPGEPAHLMIANADGTGVVPLADIPDIDDYTWSEWAPDSRHLLNLWRLDGHQTITILDADGLEPARNLDLGNLTPVEFASWRPPDGREIVFAADPDGVPPRGLYAIGADGTGLRQIGPISTDASSGNTSFQLPALSPDGSQVAFSNFEALGGQNLYLRDLTTGEQQALSLDAAYPGNGGTARFSPDGRWLLFETGPHGVANDVNAQLALAPLDGSAPATILAFPFHSDGRLAYDFSPDQTKILWDRDADGSWMIDATTGEATQTTEYLPAPSWQRLAH